MKVLNINELSLEQVGRWPLSVKIGLLLVLGLLIIALGYWLIIQDNFSQFDELQLHEVALKKDFESKQHQLYNLPAYREQLRIIKERFALMLQKLPAKNEMPGLLEDISKTGIASGLRFELFAPQPEVTREFYVELPIKISVIGTYFQLAMFLSRVAQMDRIVTLHEFTVERVSSTDHKLFSEDELLMNITAKIYRYRAS